VILILTPNQRSPLRRTIRKQASLRPASVQASILGVWQPVERELVSGEEKEATNCPNVCFGLGNDVFGGDWRSMLNLDVFGWLLLLCREPLFRRFLVGFFRVDRLRHLGEGGNFGHGGHTDHSAADH